MMKLQRGRISWSKLSFLTVLAWLVSLVCVQGLLGLSQWVHGGRGISTAQQDKPATREVEFVHRGAAYLSRVTESAGRFKYVVEADLRVDPFKYNVLRHAGAIYSLAQYAAWEKARYKEVEAAKKSAKLAALYLRSNFVKPVEEVEGVLAVWDEPSLISRKPSKQRCAKLGGAGLTLAALLSLEQVGHSVMSVREFEKLGDFILYMQRPDGGFVSKYCAGVGKDSTFESLYYPGEAALGLTHLFEKTRKEKYLQGALDALLFLAKLRETSDKVEPDHWAMIATAKVLPHLSKLGISSNSVQHKALKDHAVKVVQSLWSIMVFMESSQRDRPFDDRTTPTATRVEGLTAALEFMQEPLELHVAMAKYSKMGAEFLLRSQIIEPGSLRDGGVPSRYGKLDIRIDFVQHAICAVMHAIDLKILPESSIR